MTSAVLLQRLFVFDMVLRKWQTKPTNQRNSEPAPRKNTNYALAPFEPGVGDGQPRRFAVLVGGDRARPWHSWVLDLATFDWYPLLMAGPPVPSNDRVTATVTSTGRLYVDRSGTVAGAAGQRLYAMWAYQPHLDDHLWDALLSRHRLQIFGGVDSRTRRLFLGIDGMSDATLYQRYGMPRRQARKIRHALTGQYEGSSDEEEVKEKKAEEENAIPGNARYINCLPTLM